MFHHWHIINLENSYPSASCRKVYVVFTNALSVVDDVTL